MKLQGLTSLLLATDSVNVMHASVTCTESYASVSRAFLIGAKHLDEDCFAFSVPERVIIADLLVSNNHTLQF